MTFLLCDYRQNKAADDHEMSDCRHKKDGIDHEMSDYIQKKMVLTTK